jgi:predicted nucleotidyltransferase
MTRAEILQRLKAAETALRARGVEHAALFGSVAREEGRLTSDIDIMIDLDPTVVTTMFAYAGIKDFIADMFEGAVDVVSRESLKPLLRPQATADAVYAF